ncbi:hypothetical protein QUA82_18160 [Microcoleus sp. F8-D3]
MDFSCYVTIKNLTNKLFSLVSCTADQGTYNPQPLPPEIKSQGGQIFFTLSGDFSSGSGGSVTYSAGAKQISFDYKCPSIYENIISVSLNQTEFIVTYYGTNKFIVWNPDSSNWGPPNNFFYRGHPLNILFVIKELQG